MAPRRSIGLAVILAALVVAVLLSLGLGSNPLSVGEVWQGLWGREANAASIVWGLRGPRTVVGIIVGAAFGVAGALIQALTRNPLADPGILGVNAGAGFAVTLGVGFFGLTGVDGYVWFAFLGAAAATLLVYLIGSAGRGSATPVALVLAGVALGAVLTGFATMLELLDPELFRAVRNGGLGSIDRTELGETLGVAPFLAAGLLLAFGLAGSLNSLALGDDLAAALGTPRVAHPDSRRRRDHVAGRHRHRLDRRARLRRADGAAHRPLVHRAGSAVDHRLLGARGVRTRAALRRSRTRRGPAGRDRSGDRHRRDRAPVLIALVRRRNVSGL